MYIIQVNSDGKVIDIMKARADATADMVKVVGDIPAYEPKRGYRGELMYNSEQGLYWADVETPVMATEADYRNALAEMGVGVNDEG